MKHIRFIVRSFKTMSLILVLLGQYSNVNAKDKDCWVDLFDGAQYTGKHTQLEGPIQLAKLAQVNGENWDSRISSMKVGPKATITVFDHVDFVLTATEMAKSPGLMRSWGITEKDIKEESELIFKANAKIHDLSDFNFHQKIKSLKIDCN
ncbi:MAG: beta/gamma crystallin domain-containing protein [Methylococcales bacterium]|nr:beta/gamma crystallin domain-containing protein [Methylococcales bacterium]